METMPTGGLDQAPAGSSVGTSQGAPNTLMLSADGGDFTGWEAIRVTRRLEGCPGDFDIAMSERFPGQAARIAIKPGDECTIKLGGDLVLTGYVDRIAISVSPNNHTIRLHGRGKCEDLVDCSVTPNAIVGMQIFTSSLVRLATRLAEPYGIKVTSLTGDDVPVSLPGGAPLQFNATLTETAYEIIERVARYAGVLPYEDTDGNLLLANVGATKMQSGFAMGANVQQAAVAFSMDERYSDYLPMLMSVNFFGDQGIGGQQFPRVLDKGVTRFRPLIIVSEQAQYGQYYAEKRAQWEAARRLGRSQAVRLTADSWRDSSGKLWAVNAYAPIDLPQLKLTPPDPWIIGEVTFLVDEARGTVADLTLMPKEAFLPEPTILQPFLWDPSGQPPPGGGAAADPAPPADRGPGLG